MSLVQEAAAVVLTMSLVPEAVVVVVGSALVAIFINVLLSARETRLLTAVYRRQFNNSVMLQRCWGRQREVSKTCVQWMTVLILWSQSPGRFADTTQPTVTEAKLPVIVAVDASKVE